MKIRLAVLLLLCAGLAACEFFASRHEAPPGQAEIVVYRPGRLVAITNRYTLEVDGAPVVELTNGSFVRLFLAPGMHSLGITDRSERVWSDALRPDRRHYLQLNVSGRPPKFELAFREVEQELAEAELEGLQEIKTAE